MTTYNQEQAKKIYQGAKEKGLDAKKVMYLMAKNGSVFEGADMNAILDYGRKTYEPKQTNTEQMSPEQADKFLNKSTVGQIFSKETAQELPKAAYETLVGGAAKFIKSAIESPINIAQGLQGKEMTTANINDPVTGKPIGSYQTDFQNKILPAVESGQISPLKGTAQAVGGPVLGAVDVLGAGELVSGGTKLVKSGGTKIVGAVDNLIADSKTLADEIITRSQPKVTLEQATGQVIQGKTGDVKQAVKAISSIDTTGVKTYQDLLGKLKEKKPELLSVVDNELAKDTTQYTLDQLATPIKTNSGKILSTNYVDNALKDLSELYATTGDVKQLANLEELTNKGSYTLKEVNDISRVYNSEFGSKAFSKLGDPLTSVNAQRFENTRKGLKDVARRGLGGAEAKKADELLSSVYNTENLVSRNVEAVNKLRQRINERGLLEKAGHYITKYADILTGGTIRGAVAGLLPRGAGYKVLNALDLEEQLAKNLDIINKALKSSSDDVIVNQLKSLDLPIKNSASKTTPTIGAKTSTSKLNTMNDKSLNSSIPTVSKKNGIKSSDLSTSISKAKASGQSFDEWVSGQQQVFHGTKSDIGLDSLSSQSNSRGQYLGDGIYFTKYKEGADLYGGKTLEAIVDNLDFLDISKLKGVERTKEIGSLGTYKQYLKNNNLVDTTKNFNTWSKNQKNVADKVLQMGYKGVTDGQQHVIFDKSALKTRSQLKAEWDKVKTGLPKIK